MKYLLIVLLITTSLIAAPKEKQLVTDKEAIKLLESIKSDAIVLGNGKIEVHTFLDPLCKMSQRYLKLIYKNSHTLFEKYTLYFYFHEIKSKKSKKHIFNILNAESKERMMRAIMLNKESYTLNNTRNLKSEYNFESVAKVAKKIGVFKRPYIMIDGKVK